jgi:hypothetical protein
MILGISWGEILTLGVVPLVKWIVKYRGERKEKKLKEEAREAARKERLRLKANRLKRIEEAKENYQDIDPSKYEV